MAEPVTLVPRKRAVRPVAWDALLSLALVAITAFSSFALIGLVAFVVSRGEGRWAAVLGISVCAVVGLVLTRSLRTWPSARVHSRGWLALSAGLGILVAWLAGMFLGPWPDLLGDEAIAGPITFYLEAGKSLVPWMAGALAAFVSLRYDPMATSAEGKHEAAEQRDEADEGTSLDKVDTFD